MPASKIANVHSPQVFRPTCPNRSIRENSLKPSPRVAQSARSSDRPYGNGVPIQRPSRSFSRVLFRGTPEKSANSFSRLCCYSTICRPAISDELVTTAGLRRRIFFRLVCFSEHVLLELFEFFVHLCEAMTKLDQSMRFSRENDQFRGNAIGL